MNVDDLTEPPSARRPVSLFRMTGLVVAGLATGALAAWLALFSAYYGGTWVVGILLYTLLTLVPAVALGWNGSRSRRAYSSGLAACWIAAGGILLWSIQKQGASPEEIAEAKARIVAAAAPAYFVGDEADGHDLDEVQLSDVCYPAENPEQPRVTEPGCKRRADKQIATFWYGESCEMFGEGWCWPSVSIETMPLSWDLGRAPCRRLDPVLGVPTVWLDEPHEFDGPVVVLFTGNSLVAIGTEEAREDGDADRALELARLLRPVDATSAVTALPPPSPQLLAIVDTACPTPDE